MAEFTEPLTDISSKVGKTVTLECRISNAKAEVKWFMNGVQIFAIDRHSIIREGQRRALVIRDVGPRDIGKYSCRCGDTYTEAMVKVKCRCPSLIL